MPADLPDPDVLRDVLHRRLLRAMFPAVTRLARAARGHNPFSDDRAFRACVELVRLIPAVCGETPEPSGWEKYLDSLAPEERELKLRQMDHLKQLQASDDVEANRLLERRWDREDWARDHESEPMPDGMREEHDAAEARAGAEKHWAFQKELNDRRRELGWPLVPIPERYA